MRKIIVLSIIVGLFIVGCGNEDNNSETSQKPDMITGNNTGPESVKDIGSGADKQALQKTVLSAVEKTIEKAEELVEKVEEKSPPQNKENLETATVIAEKATGSIESGGTVTAAVAPATLIVLENKKGKINFSHEIHGKSAECVICHGEADPQQLSLDKKTGHDMCRGCHKKQEIGPTKCKGCHEKKPKVVVEGC